MTADSAITNLMVEELEKEIAEFIGTRYAVMCSSGRAGIWFSLLALGIGYGDAVVIPDFACEILPITVFCAGAVPRFCDIDRQTLTLSPTRLQQVLQQNTKAVIFVHPYGFPVDPSLILEITAKRGIAFIDDAAQALGASAKSKKAGSYGKVGVLSLSKFLDVALGGVLTTNDGQLAAKIKLIREKYESRSFFTSLGYHIMGFWGLKSKKIAQIISGGDYPLHKLLSIPLAKKYFRNIDGWIAPNPYVLKLWRSKSLTNTITNQLLTYGGTCSHRLVGGKLEKAELLSLKHEFKNLEKYQQVRRKIAKIYEELLVEKDFSRIVVPTNTSPSYLRYPVLFSNKNRLLNCIRELNQSGFVVDYRYKPLHRSPFFGTKKSLSFKESIYVSEHILPLPVTLNMSSEKVEQVASIVNLYSSK